jgi:hypothetical protein
MAAEGPSCREGAQRTPEVDLRPLGMGNRCGLRESESTSNSLGRRKPESVVTERLMRAGRIRYKRSRDQQGCRNFPLNGGLIRKVENEMSTNSQKCVFGDPYGNRTRVSAVRGPRPNR